MAANAPEAVPGPAPALMPDELDSRHLVRRLVAFVVLLALVAVSLSQAAAAVLAYRLFQLGVPAVIGAIAFIRLRHTLSQSSSPAAACAPLAEPLPIKAVRSTA